MVFASQVRRDICKLILPVGEVNTIDYGPEFERILFHLFSDYIRYENIRI